jgi:hypothetical protein
MGKSYLFECAHCGYRASVSGGADAGHDVKVQTARCRDCRMLFDAVIGLRARENPGQRLRIRRLAQPPAEAPPTLAAALNRLPAPPSARLSWRTYDLTCPNEPSHRVEPWNAPGRCPRCGDYLESSALPYRRWD